MGIVVNEQEAKSTSCKCFKLSDKELLCFSKGIVGALSDEQEKQYCTRRFIVKDNKALKNHILKFTDAVEKCKDYPVPRFQQCVAEIMKG